MTTRAAAVAALVSAGVYDSPAEANEALRDAKRRQTEARAHVAGLKQRTSCEICGKDIEAAGRGWRHRTLLNPDHAATPEASR